MVTRPPSNDNEAIQQQEEHSMNGQTIIITLDQPDRCLGAINARAARMVVDFDAWVQWR